MVSGRNIILWYLFYVLGYAIYILQKENKYVLVIQLNTRIENIKKMINNINIIVQIVCIVKIVILMYYIIWF